MKKCLFILLFQIPCFAQAKVNTFKDKKIHLSLNFETPNFEFEFQDKITEEQIIYKPNLHELTTPGISYSGLVGVSWGFKTNLSDEKKVDFGETRYEDWRFNYAFNAFMAGVSYSQYTGFYIENSGDIDPSWTDQQPFIQLPDMYVRTLGAYFTWIWEPDRFSMPGVVDQTARQEGKGGSWLFGGAISETTFNSPTGLIPATVNSQFPGATGLFEGKFTSLAAKGGYGYSIGHKWFLGGVMQAGLGMQKRQLSFQDGGSTEGWDPAWRVEVQLSGGYNGDQFYSGIKLYAFSNIYQGAGLQINAIQTNTAVFFGVHL